MHFKWLAVFLLLSISSFFSVQAGLVFKSGFEYPMQKLNDTGITWVGEYPSGNNSGCTSVTLALPQDCSSGRDDVYNNNNDGHAGFSFTKLDATGTPLTNQGVGYGTVPWSCVRDNVTNLIWEVKTTTAGIHYNENLYQWGGLTAIGRNHPNREGPYFDPSWNELVAGSNGDALCGFHNWRVPTYSELSSIVNKGETLTPFFPAIDGSYFPHTKSYWYWTSSPNAVSDATAWAVSFENGYSIDMSRDYYAIVRLVRSDQ